MSHPDEHFLEQQGFIHLFRVGPSGSAERPLPLMLSIDSGQVSASALLYREDIEELVEYLTRMLKVGQP